MDNDSFLKKFQGRTETIGKEGLLGVMNNVHINVNDYKFNYIHNQKTKKQAKQINLNVKKQNSKDQYYYITSEISKEFNQNKNFIPQLKSSIKLSNNKENNKNSYNNSPNKIKNKDDINGSNNIIPQKRNIKKSNEKNLALENRINRHINKAIEKPIKLFNSLDQKIYNSPKKYQSQNHLLEKPNKIPNNELKKNSIVIEKNNIRRNLSSRNKELNIKNNMKLPKIASQSKQQENYNTNNNYKSNINKYLEKKNTLNPSINNKIRDKFNFQNSEERPRSLKSAIKGKINDNKNKNKHNTFQGESISNKIRLPKINLFRSNNTSSKNILKKNNNIKFLTPNINNNEALNNIKRDFMMLDSLKNNGKILKSKAFKEKNSQSNNINNFNKIVNNKNINRVSNSYENDINNYNNNLNNPYNDSYIINNLNNYDMTNNMKYIYNSDNNLINSGNNINYYQFNNNEQFYDNHSENRANTSFERPQKLRGLNNRLDIINEEEEDRYITGFKNNNFNDNQNFNSLEILMNQRRNYQNRLPTNSRFKIKLEN